MPGTMPTDAKTGDENTLKGDFGETWLRVVASAAGLSHGPPASTDLEKADIELTLREEINDLYHPAVKVQVKTTADLRVLDNGDWSYDLDADTYNVLCKTNHATPRALVVVKVSDDGDRVRLLDDGTLMVGAAGWVSLMGQTPTKNSSSVAVHIPLSNRQFDAKGVRAMVVQCGARTSTEVPSVEQWEEGQDS